MTSQAYRQANTHSRLEELRTADPDNQLLAYYPPRRLTAEELRDSLLQITGELNPEVGGLPVMPEINREVALEPRMIQFSIAPALSTFSDSRTTPIAERFMRIVCEVRRIRFWNFSINRTRTNRVTSAIRQPSHHKHFRFLTAR